MVAIHLVNEASVSYQERKKAKKSNSLYLTDSQGQMLVCSKPQSGEHHDLFDIQALFEEMCKILTDAGIDMKGLFLNADAGFDSVTFRDLCAEKAIEANIPTNPRNTNQEPSLEYK